MGQLFHVIRSHRLLWLLVMVPLPLIGEHAFPDRQSLLFVLSIAAIVPLAALLSIATESVAARTGDAVGGLLNATLGNLTELIIALAALRAGEYMLVKASLAGAIVANTLFMMGASLLIGGLRHRVQQFNLANARFQIALLLLAAFGMMVPSGIADQTRRVPGFASTKARMSAGTVVWPFAVMVDSVSVEEPILIELI